MVPNSYKDEIIIQLVLEIRNQLLRIAARKLMFMLKPKLALHGLRTGRDYLFDLLAKHKLLIRKRKITTTNSGIGCTSIGLDRQYSHYRISQSSFDHLSFIFPFHLKT